MTGLTLTGEEDRNGSLDPVSATSAITMKHKGEGAWRGGEGGGAY